MSLQPFRTSSFSSAQTVSYLVEQGRENDLSVEGMDWVAAVVPNLSETSKIFISEMKGKGIPVRGNNKNKYMIRRLIKHSMLGVP